MQSNVYVGFAGPAADYIPPDIPTSRANPDIMTMIPGMFPGYSFNQPQWSASFDFAATSSPFPALAMAPLNYSPVSPQTEHSSATQSPEEYPAPPREFPTSPLREFPQSVSDFHPPQDYPRATPPAPVESQLPIVINRPLAIRRSEPFRPSAYELEPSFGASQPSHMPCQTSIFRKCVQSLVLTFLPYLADTTYSSHFNTAHYMNPDFHPEEWSPNQEYGPSHRSRNKSTSQ
jgi:ubiquitin thioesterase protein OTUB1